MRLSTKSVRATSLSGRGGHNRVQLVISSLDYFGVFLPILAQIGLGRRFVKHGNFSALIAGLLVTAAIAGPLAYLQVAWVKPILLAGLFCGLAFFVFDTWADCRERRSAHFAWRPVAPFLIAFICFLVFFRGLHFTLYVYESHDLIYFSWINEMLTADYDGPIRVGVAWPHHMASNHLLPGAMVAALSVLLPHPSLVTSIEIRYLLVCAAFACFFVVLMPRKPRDAALFGVIFLLVFSIYREEIAYDLRISSFAYVIVLFEVLKRILMRHGDDCELVFFSILLVIAKAPIFFVAASMAAWFFLKGQRSRFAWTTLCAAALALVNMATWGLVPPPQSGVDVHWSIAQPFDWISIAALNALTSWMIPDAITEMLKHLFKVSYEPFLTYEFFVTLPLALYAIVKYYAVYFAIVDQLRPDETILDSGQLSSSVKFRGLDIFMLVSLCAWVFVRNGNQFGHQAHAYLLAATVTMAVLLRTLSLSPMPAKLGAVVVCAVIFAVRVDPTDPFQYVNTETSRSPSATTYIAAPNLARPADGFYHPPAGEPSGIAQVKAAMAGLRLSAMEVPPPSNSQIYHWILR